MDKSGEIDASNIAGVFAALPHLRASRDMVLKTLETKVGEFWQEYRTKDVLEILGALLEMPAVSADRFVPSFCSTCPS